jgi:hypothetical protein
LAEAGGPISLSEIREYAVNGLGLKEFKFTQSLSESGFILRSSHSEYVHSMYMRIDRKDLEPLVHFARSLVLKYGHISILSVYRERKVTCKRLGITSDIFLYSIFRSLADESISCSGYPTITIPSIDSEASSSVLGRIIDFIKARNGACLLQALEDHFCHKLGYKEQYISLARQDHRIFRYSPSSVIHLDNLSTESLVDDTSIVAIQQFDKIADSRLQIASIENLIWNGLPELNNGGIWTITLLMSVLERSCKVQLIGPAKKTYTVKNDKGEWLSSLGLIIARILNDDFNGAANIHEVEEVLNNKNVLSGRLTLNMLQRIEELDCQGETIMLPGISKDATRY